MKRDYQKETCVWRQLEKYFSSVDQQSSDWSHEFKLFKFLSHRHIHTLYIHCAGTEEGQKVCGASTYVLVHIDLLSLPTIHTSHQSLEQMH